MSPSLTPKFKNPRARYNFEGRSCSISGVGSYVPAKVLTNADLEKMVDTSDEWITTRTGIKERRIAAKNEFTSDLGAQAALRAMHCADVTTHWPVTIEPPQKPPISSLNATCHGHWPGSESVPLAILFVFRLKKSVTFCSYQFVIMDSWCELLKLLNLLSKCKPN